MVHFQISNSGLALAKGDKQEQLLSVAIFRLDHYVSFHVSNKVC